MSQLAELFSLDLDETLFQWNELEVTFKEEKSSCTPRLGCSKLTSLINVSLKFRTLISQIRQYFLLKKCEKL